MSEEIIRYMEGRDVDNLGQRVNEMEIELKVSPSCLSHHQSSCSCQPICECTCAPLLMCVLNQPMFVQEATEIIDAKLDDLKVWLADIVKKLPVPKHFDTANKWVALKVIKLGFECCNQKNTDCLFSYKYSQVGAHNSTDMHKPKYPSSQIYFYYYMYLSMFLFVCDRTLASFTPPPSRSTSGSSSVSRL